MLYVLHNSGYLEVKLKIISKNLTPQYRWKYQEISLKHTRQFKEPKIKCGQLIFLSRSKSEKPKGRVVEDEGEAADESATVSRKWKKFSDLELSTLDMVFLSSGGAPDKGIIHRTAKALKIDEQQVIVTCLLAYLPERGCSHPSAIRL